MCFIHPLWPLIWIFPPTPSKGRVQIDLQSDVAHTSTSLYNVHESPIFIQSQKAILNVHIPLYRSCILFSYLLMLVTMKFFIYYIAL